MEVRSLATVDAWKKRAKQKILKIQKKQTAYFCEASDFRDICLR